MAKKKLSDEDWVAARLRWETEPPCTFTDISKMLGLSKQAVAQRARAEGWAKQLDMARIARLAHQKADQGSTAANAESSERLKKQAPVVVYPETNAPPPPGVDR